MAQAAQFQVANGAQIVDINMGCPAKKVCRKLAGSALLQDEDLVRRLLDSAVLAVDVPVTLKTRLGFANGQENILKIAQIAEQAGVAAITIHGRTREDFYTGQARYELITQVKRLPKSLSLSMAISIAHKSFGYPSQNRGRCCYDWSSCSR